MRHDDGRLHVATQWGPSRTRNELQLTGSFQLKKGRRKTSPIPGDTDHELVRVCFCLFVHQCLSVFHLELGRKPRVFVPCCFLQCKYVSQINGQTKGSTPYLHACRDSYIRSSFYLTKFQRNCILLNNLIKQLSNTYFGKFCIFSCPCVPDCGNIQERCLLETRVRVISCHKLFISTLGQTQI